MNVLYFCSNNLFTLRINSQWFNQNNVAKLTINNDQPIFVEVFPKNYCQYQNFVFLLKWESGELLTSDENIKIVKIASNEFFIKINLCVINNENIFCNDDYNVCNGLAIYYKNKICYNKSFYAKNCKHIILNGYNLFSFCGEKHNLLIAFNDENVVMEQEFDIVKKAEDSIQTILKTNDLFNHAIVKEFNTNNFSLTLQKTVYVKQNAVVILPTNCVRAFLECAIACNGSKIKSLLSDNLLNVFSLQKLQNFFGNFNEFYILSTSLNATKVVVVNNDDFSVFNFATNNGKISNIEKL